VVSLSADESRAKLSRRKPARNAGSGMGHVVPGEREAADLHSGISSARIGHQPKRAGSVSLAHWRQRNRQRICPEIEEESCRGALHVEGHAIRHGISATISTFRVTLSNKGWIGFSRTPHSDAVFSGEITARRPPLRQRRSRLRSAGTQLRIPASQLLDWAHAYFLAADRDATTLEALVYEMPSDWSFAKRCSGTMGSSISSAISRTTETRAKTCSGISLCCP